MYIYNEKQCNQGKKKYRMYSLKRERKFIIGDKVWAQEKGRNVIQDVVPSGKDPAQRILQFLERPKELSVLKKQQ